MARVVLVCLLGLAVNAVLIQTVMSDESVAKQLVRAGVLGVAVYAIVVYNSRVPPWMVLLVCFSGILLILRGNPDQLSYIFVLLLVPALWSAEEWRVERAAVVASFASLGLVFAFLALGITQNEIVQPRSRMTFGTAGVPFFFNLVYGAFALLVLYVVKHRPRRWRLAVVGSVAATTYLFGQTDARGGYFAFLTFLVMLVAVPRLRRSGMFRGAVALLPAWLLAGSWLLAALSDDHYYALNEPLSYRPMLYERFLDSVGLADVLLGAPVKSFPTAVDNSYIHLLVGGGLIMCGVFVVAFARAVRHLFEAGRHPEIAFLVATSLYFFSESLLVRIENVFVVYAWFLVLRYGLGHGDRDAARVSPVGCSTRPRADDDHPVGRRGAGERHRDARAASSGRAHSHP